jgi:hypothetical protein
MRRQLGLTAAVTAVLAIGITLTASSIGGAARGRWLSRELIRRL